MLTVITGPPCAGKTTYVAEHAKPGDVIIDFDAIAVALGSPVRHDHDPWLIEVAAAAWAAAVARVTRGSHGHGVWVIDASPRPERRRAYALAHAVYVDLDADPAELHRRADADGRPAEWHARIDQFPRRL